MPEVLRYVFAHLPGAVDAVPAGALTLVEEGRETLASRFAYGRNYLERPSRIPVDPKSLPLDSATLDNALSQCEQFGLPKPNAAAIITSVVAAVRSWRESFEALGVLSRECDRVAPAFRHATDVGMQIVDAAVG